MKKPLLIPAIMLILVGIGVFALPFLLGEADTNAELVSRTSTVGGGIIGIGIAFALAVLLFRKR